MSLAHAILVSLLESPQSGYDLAKKFDGSMGFFWRSTHQQIYRELNKLEELNWIAAEAVAQEGRPDKKRFTVTPGGLASLQQWLTEPCEPMPVRDELLVKVYAAHLAPPEAIAREIGRHRQLHAQKLAVYEEIERCYFDKPEMLTRERQGVYLTLKMGLGIEREWVRWCEEAIAILGG